MYTVQHAGRIYWQYKFYQLKSQLLLNSLIYEMSIEHQQIDVHWACGNGRNNNIENKNAFDSILKSFFCAHIWMNVLNIWAKYDCVYKIWNSENYVMCTTKWNDHLWGPTKWDHTLSNQNDHFRTNPNAPMADGQTYYILHIHIGVRCTCSYVNT